MFRTASTTALLLVAAQPALADVPVVVTDFGPTQGIVARVMQGVGTPVPLLSANDTPHSFAMRPSHAQLLTDADIVVWMGSDMTPWLSDPIETLAGEALSVALLETEGWEPLAARSVHDHGGDHEDDHGHGHDDDHDDDHADEHDDHNDGAGHDPHAWLDPDIAAVWAMEIAGQLSEVDPDNAVLYLANANQFWADVALLGQEMEVLFDGLNSAAILLPHDSTQYLEARFGLAPAGFIAETDAADPGPAHLRELREKIEAGAITCVLGDIETSPGTVSILTEGTAVRTATLDLTDSAGAGYIAMMRSLGETLVGCGN